MQPILLVLALLVWLPCLANAQEVDKPAGTPAGTPAERAAAAINRQIENFNESQKPDLNVDRIAARATRVQYDPKLDQLTCLDQDGKALLLLNREPDGRFKGTLEVKFHQLVGANPDGSREWGRVLATFFVDKELFPPTATK